MNVGKAPRPLQGRGIWLWVIPVALLGTGVLATRMLTAPPPEPAAEEVAPPQQVTVAALGRLEPEGEVITVGGPTGDRIERLEVAEGDFIEAGTILAYLETYGERRAERDEAASRLAEAENRMQAETQYGRAQVQEARTRQQQVDRPGSYEIQAQQATIRQLEAQLDLAEIDLERAQSLQQEGAISRQELDQQATEVRETQEALNNAKANLIRLQESWNSDRLNARAQIQSAEADLQRSQAEIQVNSARRQLQLAEARLDRTIIRAPQDGEVLRILTHPGEAISESGILELGNTRQMFVVAEVYETDIKRVQLGQQATITSRNGAFDDTLTGTVSRIGSQIFKNNVLDDDPAANADARVVEVKIRLNDSEPVAQLTNLQVDVRIDVD